MFVADYCEGKHFLNSTHNPVNTNNLHNICTMLDQRQRRWADVVQNVIQMFCVCWKLFIECDFLLHVCFALTFPATLKD